MSIDLGQETIPVSKQERTWHIDVFCENGTDYELRAYREVITLDGNGNTIASIREKVISRTVSQVLAEPDALQLLGLMKTVCDRWATE